MGSITFSFRNYIDTVSEIVAIKSGILLSQFDIITILEEKYGLGYFNGSIRMGVRIRSEEFEDAVNFVRLEIGNITEEILRPFPVRNFMKWATYDTKPIYAAFYEIINESKSQKIDFFELITKLHVRTKAPIELIRLIVDMAIHNQQQSIYYNACFRGLGWRNPITGFI